MITRGLCGLALILAVGCDGGGGGSGGGSSAADEVSYDGSESGLAAANVQAGLDEITARVAAAESAVGDHEPRLAALEAATSGAPAASAVTYDGSTSGVEADNVQAAIDAAAALAAANAARLDGLTAAEVAYVPAAAEPETDVQAALADARARVAALEASVATLQSQLEAVDGAVADLAGSTDPQLVTCPDGMIDAVGFCIDEVPREPLDHTIAVVICDNFGYSLCTAAQQVTGCKTQPVAFPVEPVEIVDELVGNDEVMATSKCAVVGPIEDNSVDLHPFRCCVTKAALVYGLPD